MNRNKVIKSVFDFLRSVLITILLIVLPAFFVFIPYERSPKSVPASAYLLDEDKLKEAMIPKIKAEMQNELKDSIAVFSSNTSFKKTYYINENGAKMYSDSNDKSKIIKCLDRDNEVVAYNEKDGYIYCEDDDGNMGWIKKDSSLLTSIAVNDSRYMIDVNLTKQFINVYEGKSLIKANIKCSTGIVGNNKTETPSGIFTIKRHETKNFYSKKYNENVMYPLKFFSSYLIHSVPVDNKGNTITSEHDKLGKPVSHGCIRVDKADAQFLYSLPNGTIVYIHY
ncbi:MAG: L,D-transpeptidase [Bacillota bacterium]|nr:L,D-transpeptidase [Bacillota bacterium]